MSGEYFQGNIGNRNKFNDLLPGLVITRQILESEVTVAAIATKIPASPIQARHSLLIQNIGNNVVYLGSPTVTTANGYPIYPRGQITIQIEDDIDLYGIGAVAGEKLRIMEGA